MLKIFHESVNIFEMITAHEYVIKGSGFFVTPSSIGPGAQHSTTADQSQGPLSAVVSGPAFSSQQ